MRCTNLLALIVSVAILLCLQPIRAHAEQKAISAKIGSLLKKSIKEARTGSVDDGEGVVARDERAEGAKLTKVIAVMNRDHLKPLPDTLIAELKKRVERLEGCIGEHAFNNVQVWIPINATEELAEWSEIRMIREPLKPKLNTVTSEGVDIIGAPFFHGYGLRGRGVKVGVIDAGFHGYSSLLGTELPASVTTKVFGSEAHFAMTNHGAAMAEIVHDIAPEADLFFANVTDVEVGFSRVVSWLESQEVDVISCSMGVVFPSEWAYETLHPSHTSNPDRNRLSGGLRAHNEVKQQWNSVVNHAVARGISWSQAGGNSGDKVWRGLFDDANGNGLLEFPCDSMDSATDEHNRIVIPPFSQDTLDAICGTYVLLTWGSGSTFRTNDDYDLLVLDENQNVVASSMIRQGVSFPHGMEICKFAPRVGKEYFVAVDRYQGSLPQEITVELYNGSFEFFDCYTPEKTVLRDTPADNPNVITVGAVPWSSPETIFRYSSQGPTAGGVIKPDLVAPTNVTTSNPGFYCAGTSCAAPHLAGACALAKQAYPSWSPSQIKSLLELNAIDLGLPGKDNAYGSGLVSLSGIVLPGVLGPIVYTETASSVTLDSATLNGTVNPKGESTVCYFEYGTNTTYGSTTTNMDVGSGTDDVSVSADVVGLDAEKTYHFRLVAANGSGTTSGSDKTFTATSSDGGSGGGGGCFIDTAASSLRW